MTKKTKTVHKKSRGRPAGLKFGGTIPARFEPVVVEAIDKWADQNAVSRSEAIRRLVELGLARGKSAGPPSAKTAERLKQLAAKTIDHLLDSDAPTEEVANRKRRLLKGPEEFREVRVDQEI